MKKKSWKGRRRSKGLRFRETYRRRLRRKTGRNKWRKIR